MEEPVKTNAGQGFGIASLILGILALLIAFIPCIGIFALIPGIIAVVLGIVGLSQARNANGTTGLIISGLVISSLATLIAAVWLIFFSASGLFLNKLNEDNKLDIVIEEFVNQFEKEFEDDQNIEIESIETDPEKTLEELEKSDSLNAKDQNNDTSSSDSINTEK